MKEACRLLNKSIIRVEQPDIQLEEDEEEMAMGQFNICLVILVIFLSRCGCNGYPLLIRQINLLLYNLDEDAPPSPSPDVEQASQESAPQTKKPMTMTYEAYKQMTNLILYHMKQQEQVAELGECT